MRKPSLCPRHVVICARYSTTIWKKRYFTTTDQTTHLVLAGEWRNRLALSLVQSVTNDGAVANVYLVVCLLLPTESVLHPVLVVTVWVVLTGVGTTRLLAVGSGLGGLDGAGEEVAELEGLNKVRVPDHAAVLDSDV